jgi:hypothetical protein
MILQQRMKCDSVLEVRPAAETGQDVVICEDQEGNEYVYKIIPSASTPIVAMIDYHSSTAAPTATQTRMPLPPDTTTDCAGPFYMEMGADAAAGSDRS